MRIKPANLLCARISPRSVQQAAGERSVLDYLVEYRLPDRAMRGVVHALGERAPKLTGGACMPRANERLGVARLDGRKIAVAHARAQVPRQIRRGQRRRTVLIAMPHGID